MHSAYCTAAHMNAAQCIAMVRGKQALKEKVSQKVHYIVCHDVSGGELNMRDGSSEAPEAA